MGYHFEIWLRGFAKDHLRKISDKDSEIYHPKITLVRPFDLVSDEDVVLDKVSSFCKGKRVLPFYLEGCDNFDGMYSHVPVFEDGRLMEFNDGLEKAIVGNAEFVREIESVKNFHATIDDGYKKFSCSRINQYMLRLTGIRNKKIWASWDFVTGKVLNREESLDKNLWYKTVDKFWENK